MSEDYGSGVVLMSDEDSEEDAPLQQQQQYPRQPMELQGTVSKWTNYIHGWQNRFMVLKDGTMSYYRNNDETEYGCRGSISVQKAHVKPHEIDECRFDVCLNDCVWYLRTGTVEEKHQWVDAIEQHKCNGHTPQCMGISQLSVRELENNGLRRHGSAVSLTSTTLSTTSGSSLKRAKGLHEKLAEIDTYRDILIRQMEALQTYFDACAESVKELKTTEATCNGHGPDIEGGVEAELAVECNYNLKGSPIAGSRRLSPNLLPPHISRETLEKHGAYAIDFRGEALTFKATTAGILTTLGHCVDVMNQREESFKRRLEREGEKRKRLEEKLKHALSLSAQESPTARRVMVMGGPDYEEGPHSVMGEDEFFDAVESALDKMDEEEEFRERLRLKQLAAPQKPATTHPLWPEIDKVTKEQLSYAQQDVDGGVWQLFAEEGEMKMYRRELEEDGLVVDPLKAVHQIRGATAHEMAHHFWSPDVRFEWETTLEQVTVIDRISDDTLLFLQLHKRVWPTAQRDALFWSHIREIPKTDPANGNAHDTWIVCNKSSEHPDAPNDGKCVRVDLEICFVCQTFIDPPPAEGEPITRDNLLTKIIYCSVVNPGGWAPASVLRTVYKREYPKFLKRFTQYVVDKSADQPIAFSGLKIKDQNKHWRG